jgi:hypothetical protein
MLQLIVKHDSIEVNSLSASCAKIRHRRKEGDMARIRVDTEELKNKAEDFAAAADSVGRAGDEILAVAMALPSYEGQLSGPARAAGYEIQRRARDMQAALAGDADLLDRNAADFAAVDHRTVDLLAQNQEAILASPPAELRGIDIGDSYLGYRDDGLSDTVILCMYGTCREIPRAGNEEAIKEFEKYADDYKEQKEKMMNEFYKTCVAAVAATGALVVLSVATAGVATAIAGIGVVGAIGSEALAWKDGKDAQEKMADDTFGAAYYWNKLFGETGLGECVTGDNEQQVGDIWTRHAADIYDP